MPYWGGDAGLDRGVLLTAAIHKTEAHVLDDRTINRLRTIHDGDHLVVSLYLGLKPDLDELRSIPARIKASVRPLRELADQLSAPAARSLLADIDALIADGSSLGADRGRGVAVFRCAELGLDEKVTLPASVRDRAVVDSTPYLSPLEAMVDQLRPACAVVVDRRKASIYRFHFDQLEAWEEMAEEDVRKDNYGGFSGYDEQRVRQHADEVSQRLFRAAAGRLSELYLAKEFDHLVVGGNHINVEDFVKVLPARLSEALAGTFTADPASLSPHDVATWCRRLGADHGRSLDDALATAVVDRARSGGRAVLGLDGVMGAANQRAIDRLLVAAGDTEEGRRCRSCGWLSRNGTACVACGGETRRVPDLYDTLAEMTRDSGGSVRFLLSPTALSSDAVAADLRFVVADNR